MSRSFNLRSFDVAVVGAGPAGATAALTLATAGVNVALIEKSELPRYKVCGGGLVRRARRLLWVDPTETIERECYVAEANALDAGVRVVVERDEPIISMTTRAMFDHLLASAARDAGAHLLTGCEVLGVEEGADRVRLLTARGEVSARFAVAADGVLSRVARAAGWKNGRHLIPALESELVVEDDIFENLMGAARFDFDVVPHGYAWVFPKRERLSVGVLSFQRGTSRLPERLERY